MAVEMTNKQKMFVKEYLKDLNGTQAAIRAGYSEDSAKEIASENLTKPNIREALDKELEARTKKVEISAEYVLSSLKQIADRCMQAEEVTKYDSDAKDYVGIGEYKFDSSGANKSLELIGKYLKMWTDKTETENKNTNVNMTLEEYLSKVSDKDEY